MLKEKRVLKSVTIDYETSSINVVHLDEITRDDVVVAATPHREVFTVETYDRMKEVHPDLAGKFGNGILGWNSNKAKAARAARDGATPTVPPTGPREDLPVSSGSRTTKRATATKSAPAKKAKK